MILVWLTICYRWWVCFESVRERESVWVCGCVCVCVMGRVGWRYSWFMTLWTPWIIFQSYSSNYFPCLAHDWCQFMFVACMNVLVTQENDNCSRAFWGKYPDDANKKYWAVPNYCEKKWGMERWSFLYLILDPKIEAETWGWPIKWLA